jgi:hypothetical protein
VEATSVIGPFKPEVSLSVTVGVADGAADAAVVAAAAVVATVTPPPDEPVDAFFEELQPPKTKTPIAKLTNSGAAPNDGRTLRLIGTRRDV